MQEELACSQEEITVLFDKYYATISDSTFFDLWKFILFVADDDDNLRTQLETALFDVEIYQRAIFPEVIKILSYLSANYTLGIFSQGVKRWQEFKLLSTGLIANFSSNHIFIDLQKIDSDYLRDWLPEGAVIIDDKKEVIDALLAAGRNFRPIWINRNSEEKHGSVETIHTLDELPALLSD